MLAVMVMSFPDGTIFLRHGSMPIKPFLNLLTEDWQSDVDVAILNACNILSLCDDSSIGWGDTLGWGNTVGYDPRCKVSYGDTHQGYHPDHPPTDSNLSRLLRLGLRFRIWRANVVIADPI